MRPERYQEINGRNLHVCHDLGRFHMYQHGHDQRALEGALLVSRVLGLYQHGCTVESSSAGRHPNFQWACHGGHGRQGHGLLRVVVQGQPRAAGVDRGLVRGHARFYGFPGTRMCLLKVGQHDGDTG